VRISRKKLFKLIVSRNWTLNILFREAGVSKTAYYHLLGKDELLPKSLQAIAQTLGVSPSALLEDEGPEMSEVRALVQDIDRIAARHPSIDRDTVRHTLLCLRDKPIDRLRRSLIRGKVKAKALELDRIIKSKEAVRRPKK
jgi:DNA-binding Xre family transcriptional regulator